MRVGNGTEHLLEEHDPGGEIEVALQAAGRRQDQQRYEERQRQRASAALKRRAVAPGFRITSMEAAA